MSRLPSRMIAPLPWSFSSAISLLPAIFLFRLSFHTSVEEVETWACEADGLSSAPGKRFSNFLVPCQERRHQRRPDKGLTSVAKRFPGAELRHRLAGPGFYFLHRGVK